MGWHPHLHVLLTDGGWLPDGSFRHLLAFDSSQVEKLFRAEVLRLLVARGKISDEVVQNLLSWQHSGFSVHAGAPVEERSEAVRLGRYGIRCPLVLERLDWDETSGEVVYRARPGRQDARGESVARWDVLEFLARCSTTCRTPASSCCATGAGTATRHGGDASATKVMGGERHAPREPGSSRRRKQTAASDLVAAHPQGSRSG